MSPGKLRAPFEGLSFLELKHQLLLHYCQLISFYLLKKLRGEKLTGHPCVRQLVEVSKQPFQLLGSLLVPESGPNNSRAHETFGLKIALPAYKVVQAS